MKLTPWFPGTVKPVRVGVYERQYSLMRSERLYCHWDGKVWSTWARTPRVALKDAFMSSMFQNLPWRGVMK